MKDNGLPYYGAAFIIVEPIKTGNLRGTPILEEGKGFPLLPLKRESLRYCLNERATLQLKEDQNVVTFLMEFDSLQMVS